MTNYTYFVSLIIANVAIAVATVGYATNFFDSDRELGPWPTVIAAISVLWLASVLNFGGARRSGTIVDKALLRRGANAPAFSG